MQTAALQRELSVPQRVRASARAWGRSAAGEYSSSSTRHSTQAPHCPAQASASHVQVTVWFPGGAFLVGSASTYDGSELAAREKTVLELLQHRLGILGFLRWAGNQESGLLGNWAQRLRYGDWVEG